MDIKRSGMGPGNRLEMGAAIIAAAQVVDTALIKPRLTAFMTAHRSYVGAQSKVETAEADVETAQAKLALRDADLDEAVEALARALVNEKQPRANPFAAFGAGAPSVVKKLTARAAAQAIHRLVAKVQHHKTLSQRTRDTARAADQAARSVESALLAIEQLVVSLREARRQRDTIGKHWDTALANLRHGARFAAGEGAPQLYAALFEGVGRSTRKNGKPTPTPAPTPVSTSPDAPAAPA